VKSRVGSSGCPVRGRAVPWLAFNVLLAVLSSGAAGAGIAMSRGDGVALAFGHAFVVDHQRGEPILSVPPALNAHGFRDIYVSAPFGFSTTASFIWKSEDDGQTFHLIGDEAPPIGKPALS
jgi:hypothetical protein